MEPVRSQCLQLLRVSGCGRWLVANRIARTMLFASVFLPAAGCGFGIGRHDDDNRNRRGSMECVQTVPCTPSAHWDPGRCQCVGNENPDGETSGDLENPDGGISVDPEGPPFDGGATGAEENEDGNQSQD